jgi:hypothetical protein
MGSQIEEQNLRRGGYLGIGTLDLRTPHRYSIYPF